MENINRPTIKVTWNAGFFSCTTDRLRNILSFHHQQKILPFVDSSEQYELYKDDGIDDISQFWRGNVRVSNNNDITEKFFEKKDIINDFLPDNYSVNCDYPKNSEDDQFSFYKNINHDYTSKIIDQYFSPSNEVLEFKNEIIEKYNLDLQKTISVCFRGNDKSTETNLPSYDEIGNKVIEAKNLYPDHKILVQTDEVGFDNYMLSKFPDCIILNETKKISNSRTAVQYTIGKGNRVLSAQKFLSIMYILSESSVVILNSGNVSLWISLFRKNSDNLYQYLSPYSTNNDIKWFN
jgi:hypothetical protein